MAGHLATRYHMPSSQQHLKGGTIYKYIKLPILIVKPLNNILKLSKMESQETF